MKKFLISPQFIWFCISLIFLVHAFAALNFWYWKFWWLDIVLHFAGGLIAASVFFYLISRYPQWSSFISNFVITFILVLAFVALIGVLWEFFEFGLDKISGFSRFGQSQVSIADTMSDLFMDLLGAAVFALIYKFSKSQ